MGATIGVAILVGGIALSDLILTAIGGIGAIGALLLSITADAWARDTDTLADEVTHRVTSDAPAEAQAIASIGRWALIRKRVIPAGAGLPRARKVRRAHEQPSRESDPR